ncbi:hypothetical protein J2T55_001306 [Methylohalomonas lacus]|uniref:DUF4340 domain-containing protein n=1 Tax=Methylohalomonas lacus TaxID=398773 RepID=A0AAE3HLF0_9GAMM|nr:DUF4340 domain-containing protein [Methylohalomonas lacus]MCS3903286.1 hypothetical protein [Methylohalomonas lacus]
MRPRLLLNLLLLLGIGVLGTWFWLQPASEQDRPESISPLNINAVQHLRIERPDQPTIELERRNRDWRVIAPLRADAEDSRVESILLLPLSASAGQFPASDANLEEFGLEPPQLTITYDSETFVVGDTSPLDEERRYVLYDDEIHLFDARLYQRLNAPLNYYINPSLTPTDSELTGIRLPGGQIRKDDGDWRAEPDNLTHTPAITADAWQRTRASYVKQHENNDAEYDQSVSLEFAGQDPIRYRVVATDPQIILARPEQGLQYHLPAELLLDLGLTTGKTADTNDAGEYRTSTDEP